VPVPRGSLKRASPMGSATATAGAATLNARRGRITSEALTTAAGAQYTLTLTNSFINTSTLLLVTVDNGTNTRDDLTVQRVTVAAGSAVIIVKNTGASLALNGTIVITFLAL
jgi:hypothetical protein